jgi:hypothetical protein
MYFHHICWYFCVAHELEGCRADPHNAARTFIHIMQQQQKVQEGCKVKWCEAEKSSRRSRESRRRDGTEVSTNSTSSSPTRNADLGLMHRHLCSLGITHRRPDHSKTSAMNAKKYVPASHPPPPLYTYSPRCLSSTCSTLSPHPYCSIDDATQNAPPMAFFMPAADWSACLIPTPQSHAIQARSH